MVCDRCTWVISKILEDMGITPLSISLGVVDFGGASPNDVQLTQFQQELEILGFSILQSKKSKTIEKIKVSVIELVSLNDEFSKLNFSSYLSEKLSNDYNYLSTLFSSVEGITVEQYFINQKIEKAKELIVYDELNLTEISQKLGYSSLSHLSHQFKKVTGLAPSHFKKLKDEKSRKSLDKV